MKYYTLVVAGDNSFAVSECSFCFNLVNSTLLKMEDSRGVQRDLPVKVTEAFRYFL